MNVPLICDCGLGVSKVGFAGTEAPLAVFPTILGKLCQDGSAGAIPSGTSGFPAVHCALTRESPVRRVAPEGRSGRAYVFQKLLVGMEEEDWFIGNEVQKTRGKLNLKYPISRAAITNWDNMEKIWHYSFYQVLHVAPEQHPLMLTEPPLNPTSSKEKALQVRGQGEPSASGQSASCAHGIKGNPAPECSALSR
ncbi:hypothetical protein EI555_000388 [Monodon monoceros]|uniref:Uncharacterized protein n=1 Tax=Monodon monoceros TaxID=40151 RepID=A0A4U1FPW7_MONMO|nr:hypothetical protein EI555_000388 [Monodon monoceros]